MQCSAPHDAPCAAASQLHQQVLPFIATPCAATFRHYSQPLQENKEHEQTIDVDGDGDGDSAGDDADEDDDDTE